MCTRFVCLLVFFLDLFVWFGPCLYCILKTMGTFCLSAYKVNVWWQLLQSIHTRTSDLCRQWNNGWFQVSNYALWTVAFFIHQPCYQLQILCENGAETTNLILGWYLFWHGRHCGLGWVTLSSSEGKLFSPPLFLWLDDFPPLHKIPFLFSPTLHLTTTLASGCGSDNYCVCPT